MGPQMTRLPDWDLNLNAVIERHRDMPGAWGQSDCWMLTMEAVEAMTGERILPKLRGYASEKAGYRLFAKHGFGTVKAALESVLGPVGTLMAKRGDIACVSHAGGISCGPVTAIGIAIKTLDDTGAAALVYHPQTAAMAAFKVG